MNIVKLKDILMPENLKISKFFNENLKGKYAYWVKMRFIFPLNSLDYKTYIKYEQLDAVHLLGPDILPHIDLYSEECCMADVVNIYLDIEETERINNISEYSITNEYTADSDLDISKLRNFRSWLASELLYFNTKTDGTGYLNNYTPEQIHVLEYYKNNMYNDIIKQLSIFGYDKGIDFSITNKSCGCCNNSIDIYSLNGNYTCNALDIYKKNIHLTMVEMFREISFWSGLNKKFIALFKKYIDNIIKIKLIINNENASVISECQCSITNDSSNEKYLRNLSESLQYIYDDDIIGHKNFIQDSLYNWAEYLYDYMSWKID